MFLCLVTLTFDTQNKWVSRLMMEHFYVTFGDPSFIGFCNIVWKNEQTEKHNWQLQLHFYQYCISFCIQI